MSLTKKEPKLQEITKHLKGFDSAEKKLIKKAYDFSKQSHEGQFRKNGEPYFNHTFQTAKILAQWGMDTTSIVVGFLHDTIEDTDVDEKTIEKEFDKDILFLIEGVTKLGKLKYHGIERHVESLRKLFLATSKDVRVVIIKLADRLHNMRTLNFLPENKQKRIALEVLEIYAPVASRLGMGKIKGEMEDLAFPYILPKEYKETVEIKKNKIKTTQERLKKVDRKLKKKLKENNITPESTDYRIKHLYSLYKKLKKYDMDPDKVHDLVALRITVPEIQDCYQALGVVHSLWRPIKGRIKDYIANPKPNGYQSLHTTVFSDEGDIAEIQIRTKKMHEEAEYGIANHFLYKEGRNKKANLRNIQKQASWVKKFNEINKEDMKNDTFLKNLKMDFFNDRVFVFTPKGDVVDLPEESCPIDFAFAIHSDIGYKADRAKINEKISSLDKKLKNGDIVEIVTNESRYPSRKWLDYTKTTLARKHIKNYLKNHSLIGRFFPQRLD